MCMTREEAERQARAEEAERAALDTLTEASETIAREQQTENEKLQKHLQTLAF